MQRRANWDSKAEEEKGLVPDQARSRVSVAHIYNASKDTEEQLYALWANKSVTEAQDALEKDDVEVTNQKDKEGCLANLPKIVERVRVINENALRSRLQKMNLRAADPP
jgi:hypothetical protein